MDTKALDRLVGGKLQNMLASYLQTVVDLAPEPVFFMQRSERVDLLLQRLVARPDLQAATQLGVELTALHERPVAPTGAASGWARRVAPRVHPIKGAVSREARRVGARRAAHGC